MRQIEVFAKCRRQHGFVATRLKHPAGGQQCDFHAVIMTGKLDRLTNAKRKPYIFPM
jgi:hypothetical protein